MPSTTRSQIDPSRAEIFLREASNADTFDAAPLRRCSDPSFPAPGKFQCELTVTAELTNRFGTLHGGCVATIVDVLTTVALLTLTDRGGVSTDLSCSYVAPAVLGERVRVECEVIRAGRTLAWMECAIKRISDNSVLATGKHTKFLPVGGTSKL
ncbi:Phenylacetic acid degradation-related domain [Ostreococcus tauri]|uniref:Acyl-coenzyme A thioesterase 13 n=1 Tax=Ostreococcus tauri TaxID=70448 RepID=Q01E36_OSTTA|nr:Phenylacetic acid degradation-related domain [Ostreococcus tauri]OUS42151.1 HGG motif-containing thioesterase [Ostreococcus tauri]CAL52417.1 Phenylacetic acid degradation-related domain [Ostreococcus tauri]|eukprot:XP_003075145.1 Phenylacetic acid degradation-related domain [Ostreococcus tauri]